MSTRTARRRLWLLGASALAALAVVAILMVVSQSGAGGGGGSSKPQATHLFDGIRQHGATLGDPKAAVKMVEFVDLQCPYCAEYTRDVLPTLVKRYVRYVTPDFLRARARGAGLDPEPIVAASQSSATAPLLIEAEREASQRGSDSTPSFLLGRRGGSLGGLQVSQLQPGEFTGRIDALLNR